MSSIVIHPSHAYALLGGLYVGKFTNFFSDIVITGLVLYIVTPQIFTADRIDRATKYFWSWFGTKQNITIKMSDISKLELTDEQKIKLKLLEADNRKAETPITYPSMLSMASLPKIEVLSPYPN